MTGEELNRKYHELRGWRAEQNRGYVFYHKPSCVDEVGHSRCDCSGAPPPLHLNANLAIAEARKVFPRGWTLKHDGGRTVYFVPRIEPPILATIGEDDNPECEAVLEALIAAKESQ